ncbi:MAG TPA: heavy metal translocating P-type ATPase, partial [Kofleriaceae bacterium]|nr:heavy metal translocating P-type ATPase [Kofleriaceae bacterium]
MAQTIDLPVLGMTCAACVRRVERAVEAVPGVTRAEVNLPLSRARIEMEGATPLAAATAIRAAGYDVPADALDPVAEHRADAIARAGREEVGSLRRDATLAIALTIPLVAIAMLARAGAWSVTTQLALGTIVVVVAGRRYLRLGALAVRHRSPDMNTLIALGAGTAWLWSTIAAARWLAGTRAEMPELYFEAGAAIVAFVMVGKLLESKARARVGDAVRGLISLVPAMARRGDGDVDVSTLVAGDAISIRPGERIAADGTVVEGSSSIDEAMLTGESMPVDKSEGSPVYAGTLNHHGALVVRVARAGAQTALARIARAVEDAQGAKAPIARLADRVSAWFVPAVLAIAVATFGGWLVAGASASAAIEHAVAVLVIACPCALGLATPAAVAVGTSRGAELGALFKGGDAVETASRIDLACLDKTGTLTHGTPSVVSDVSDDILRGAASIEQASEHPLAKAIVTAARDRDLALEAPHDVTVEVAGGIAGTIGDGQARRRIAVGNRAYIASTSRTHVGRVGASVEAIAEVTDPQIAN